MKPDSEKRTARLPVVQLTPQQLDDYAAAAEAENKTKSDWVRDTLDAQVRRTLKKKASRN